MSDFDDKATVSGSVVSIENGADEVGAKSCVVTIPPTLSGVSSVTETQMGKNWFFVEDSSLFPRDNNTIVNNIGTYTAWAKVKKNTDYYIKKSGNTNRQNVFGCTSIPAVGVTTYMLARTEYATNEYRFNSGEYEYIGFYYSNEASENMMLSTSHDALTPYEPYQTPTQYTASLGRTIYGGQVDIVNGTGEATHTRYEITGQETGYFLAGTNNNGNRIDFAISDAQTPLYSGGLSNYGENKACLNSSTWTIGAWCIYNNRLYIVVPNEYDTFAKALEYLVNEHAQFVYPLATPTDFTFAGQEVPTRLGYNAFWSEQGDTELTYYKSGYGFTSVTVNRSGKNLLPNKTYQRNANTLRLGTDTLEGRLSLKRGTYTLSLTSDVVIGSLVYTIGGTSTAITFTSSGTRYYGSFTLSEDTDDIFLHVYKSGGITSENVSDIMLETGSPVSSYVPYEAPVRKTAKLHKVIYGGEVDVIKGTAKPKNLLKLYTRASNNGIDYEINDDGSLHQYGTATANAYNNGNASTYDACPLKLSAGTYTLSVSGMSATTMTQGRVYLGCKNKADTTVANVYRDSDGSYTFTINEDFGVWFWVFVASGRTIDENVYITLEKNTSGTGYAPHFEPFTFQPISMETDEGENTLFANEGDSAITYRKAVD